MPNLTIDPQSESLTASQPVPVNPSHRNIVKAILIGVLIFVLLSITAYGAYWYTKNYLVIPSSQPTTSNVSSETSQPKNSFSNLNNQATPAATDEMANWKLFASGDILKKINISFTVRYPTNWVINENNPNHTSAVPWVIFSEKPVKDVMSRTSSCFSVGGGIWDNTTATANIIKEKDSGKILSPNGSLVSDAPKILTTENVTINSMDGIKRKIIRYGEDQPSWQVILRGGGNYTYGNNGINIFVIESCPGTSDDVFTKTLSTFNFPNESSSWNAIEFSPTISFNLPPDVKKPLYVNAGRYAQETILPGGTIFQLWGSDGASPGGKESSLTYDLVLNQFARDTSFRTKWQSFTVSGKRAIEFTSNENQSTFIIGGAVYSRIRGLFIETPRGLLMVAHYASKDTKEKVDFEEDDILFDQILATLKFLP